MVEGALNAAAELVLEATAYGNLLERDGNRSPHVAPQGLYRGRDDETWLAISVATDDAVGRRWSTRSAVPTWALDPELATYAGRRARHDELDARLGGVEPRRVTSAKRRSCSSRTACRPRSGAIRAR